MAALNRRLFVNTGIVRQSRQHAEKYEPLGYLDPSRYSLLKMSGLHLRVLVDGEDVTDRCYFADDREGIAGLYVRDETQAAVLRDVRHGKVRFIRQ